MSQITISMKRVSFVRDIPAYVYMYTCMYIYEDTYIHICHVITISMKQVPFVRDIPLPFYSKRTHSIVKEHIL